MLNTRAIAALAAIAVIALLGWFLLRPRTPPLPPVAAEKPWPGASLLVGRWSLHKDQPYDSGNCRQRARTDYALALVAPKPPLDDAVRGSLAIRERRSGGGCAPGDRSEAYDVIVEMGPFQDLEMTMRGRSCSENGKPCPGAFTDRKGTVSLKNGVLLFGSDSLKRER